MELNGGRVRFAAWGSAAAARRAAESDVTDYGAYRNTEIALISPLEAVK